MQVCLINYKQSGDKFWNQFYLAPVLDENNCVSHYMGIQSDVSHLMSQDGASQTEGMFSLVSCKLDFLLCSTLQDPAKILCPRVQMKRTVPVIKHISRTLCMRSSKRPKA